jgi:cubilin
VYTAVEGSVSHGTGNYANSATCMWTITTGNPGIYLTFAEFAVEYASGCASDAVKVYDGTSASAPLLATFCGTSSTTFEYPGIGKECAKATSGSMFIRFTSNAANVDTGFVATWDSPAPSPSPTPSPTPAPTSIPTGIPLYAPASRRPSTLAGLLGRRGLRVVPDGAFEWLC